MFTNTASKTPIAVYQMGKVGSETIVNSLKQIDLGVPIYHVHILSHQNIEIALNNYQQKQQPLTLQLENSRLLRKYLARTDNPTLNVITAVREPVSQFISAFFQNVRSSHPDLVSEQGNLRRNAIYKFLTKRLSNYQVDRAWNCNWFDRDFKPALGIDVYQHKFDRELGYTQLNSQNIKVLLLQLEKSEDWGKIISEFLQLSKPIKIIKSNVSGRKDYKRVYQHILDNLEIPSGILENIYQCQYCQHFYSNAAINYFINRWSQKNKIAN